MISIAHPRYGDPTCSICGAIMVPDGSPFPQYAWNCMSCGSRDAAKPEPSKEEHKKAESIERRLVEAKTENAKLRADNKALLDALKGLLADIEEYQTINNLGGRDNHAQVLARAAIEHSGPQ